jgi:hypothetical protein
MLASTDATATANATMILVAKTLAADFAVLHNAA